MQNVVLIIHLLLAISLIGLVLLQRSEGGGLGMGGGGAGGGAMSGRAAASALTKLTWGLAIARFKKMKKDKAKPTTATRQSARNKQM